MKPYEAIEFVKDWMEPQLKDGVDCPCCGRFTKVYRRNLNSGMVRFLMDFYNRHGTNRVSIANYHVTDQQHAHHQEYEKLPHWGLLEHDNSIPRRWWIKKLGRQFINGQVTVNKYVWLKHGVCVDKSIGQISIKQAIGNKFSYEKLMSSEV